MIRLGLRLTLGSGREAALRVLVTAAAVALGVGLLLACLAGVNGLHAQTDRGAWLDTSAQASRPTSTSHRLWWLSSTDQFGNQAIDRIDVAAAGPNAPVPPGSAHLPGPGQYYASPALTTLLRSEPVNELSDRFPGRQIGTIGAAALPSPNSLIIVIGHTARQLSQAPGAVEVGAIQRTPANCYACQNTIGSGPVLQFILAGGAVALFLPVLILIATASRLSAARREERFAAMRLVGATPRQISVVSAVEAVVAAVAGVAVGFALFFVFRPLLYQVPFTGAPLLEGDLSLHLIDIMLVVIGVPVAAVVSARLALRRVQISPLGVNRRASSRPPRIVRIIPLLAGIAVLAYFDAAGKPGAIGSQLLELLVGFVLLVVGLVLAGPWFTTAGSRLMVKRASRPAMLIAGRRWLRNEGDTSLLPDDLLDGRPGPEEQAETAEMGDRVRMAVAVLPPGQRQAVLAFYWNGLTHAKTALELGTSPGAVKARLHQARAALAPQLEFYRPFIGSMTSRGELIMIEVEVTEVRRASGDDTTRNLHVIVLKERAGTRRVPIYTGPAEAVALACTLEAVEMPRPMTYQMAASLVGAAGSQVVEVRITRLVESTFYAVVVIDGPAGTAEVDARPSDALNLALISGAPIRVDASVLDDPEATERTAWEQFPTRASELVAEVEQNRQDLVASLSEETPC